MTTIKEKDFVQIEYTGKIKDDDTVFDTTNEDIAKSNNIHNQSMPYGQYIICVGEGQLLPGLEEEVIGKELNKEYSIDIPAEKGFGKKDPKMLKLIPTSIFKKQGIQVAIGLQVNIDGAIGTIKTVTGGRTIVDFNHPLSSKELTYTFKINKIINDDKEKLESYIKMALNLKDVKAEIKEGKAEVTLKQDMPKEVQELLKTRIKETIKNIKDITFKKEA